MTTTTTITVTLTCQTMGDATATEAAAFAAYVTLRLRGDYPDARMTVTQDDQVSSSTVLADDEILEDVRGAVEHRYWNDWCARLPGPQARAED
ncbi:MAG TPA: hypothetical protein VGA36_09020 [Nitriliruptorales bacterium]